MPDPRCAACTADDHAWTVLGEERFTAEDVVLRRWWCTCSRCGCAVEAVAVTSPGWRGDQHRLV